MGQRLVAMPSSTMETRWKTAPKPKARQRDAKKTIAAADQRQNSVEQAERIECGGDAQPENAYFSHDCGKRCV